MDTVVTLDKAKELVARKDVSGSSVIDVSDKKVKFTNDDEQFYLNSGKKEYKVSDTAVKSLLNTLDLPLALATKIQPYPDLMSHNINYIMKNKGGSFRTLRRKDSIVGFCDPSNTVISNSRIIRSLEKVFGPELLIEKCDVGTDGAFDINVAGSGKSKLKVEKGDYFKSGVHVHNAPFGMTDTLIEGYLCRLACTNGMIANDQVFKAPRELGDDVNEWLKSNIKEASDITGSLFGKIKKLRDKSFKGDPVVFLSSLFDELKIPERMQTKILYRVGEHGADNMYDLLNHITYTSSHNRTIRTDPQMRNRLMRMSSHFVDHAQEICGTCNRSKVSLN